MSILKSLTIILSFLDKQNNNSQFYTNNHTKMKYNETDKIIKLYNSSIV